MKKDIKTLRDKLLTITRLGSAVALLGWDEEVNLPKKAHTYRGEVQAQLAADLHKKMTDRSFIKLVEDLNKAEVFDALTSGDQVIVREVLRDIERAKKIPEELVKESAELTSQAFGAWAEARQKSTFSIFEPYLKKIVKLNQREAEYIGYTESPYDALLDAFEPGLTARKVEDLFVPLTSELKKLIQQAAQQKIPTIPKATYDRVAQKKLNEAIAAKLGYDFEAGRLDVSPHPFTIDFHPTDVRITTRYSEEDFWEALGSTIHETGHALYQQGLPLDGFGTPLSEPVSLGIHESQSRIWENFVGKSRSFVEYLYPLLIDYFGKQTIQYSSEELYAWLNRVQPNLIRVESDEVTYNMHILLRFEIEKSLIEGDINAKDVPDLWNAKVKEYLGINVSNDALGALQDIHWSHGTLGYFPTYTLGNIYSAQLYNSISKAIPNLSEQFTKGNFKPFLAWLRKEIHRYGRTYQPEELIKHATGELVSSKHLLAHLESKINKGE